MKKTLITGATGHLGGRVAKLLAERAGSDQLVVLTRRPDDESAAAFRERGIEVREGDYDDQASLEKAFTGIEVLYFVSSSDVENRLPQHRNVVDAARTAGVQHILYTSSVRKTEGPDTVLHPIIEAHSTTERWIRESGIDYTFLRHNLYAEVVPLFIGDREQLLNGQSIYLPAGHGRVALVPRTDLAEAEAKVLADPTPYRNRILEFNGSESVTFSEIAALLTDLLDKPISYTSPEREAFRETMSSAGVPEAATGMMDLFATGIAEGEFAEQSNDLQEILGRKTQSLQDFFREAYS